MPPAQQIAIDLHLCKSGCRDLNSGPSVPQLARGGSADPMQSVNTRSDLHICGFIDCHSLRPFRDDSRPGRGLEVPRIRWHDPAQLRPASVGCRGRAPSPTTRPRKPAMCGSVSNAPARLFCRVTEPAFCAGSAIARGDRALATIRPWGTSMPGVVSDRVMPPRHEPCGPRRALAAPEAAEPYVSEVGSAQHLAQSREGAAPTTVVASERHEDRIGVERAKALQHDAS